MPTIEWSVRSVRDLADIASVRVLFLEYQEWLGVDLCFQGFAEELDNLPGAYAPPEGCLLLAMHRGEPVGCAGVRSLKKRLPAGRARLRTCELKRLYVRPAARGEGIGKALLRRALRDAFQMRYDAIVLDTLPGQMLAAKKLYEDFDFVPCEPYYDNPLEGVEFMFRRLT